MENNNKLKEYVKEEMQFLPREIQEVIGIFEWERISGEIGKKYKLTDDEILTLQTETALVLLGLVDQQLYSQNIANNIGLSEQEAKTIENEITQKIFNPLMNKLTENIKKTLMIRNIHWQQNLNFILSGGDYTAFIRRVENPVSSASNTTLVDKENTNFNPSKLDDLKSKFTI